MFRRGFGDQLLGLLQPLGLGVADRHQLGPLLVRGNRLDVVAADPPAAHQSDADAAIGDRGDGVEHAKGKGNEACVESSALKRVDRRQAEVLKMAEIAGRKRSVMSQSDTGDQGVAQVNWRSQGFA